MFFIVKRLNLIKWLRKLKDLKAKSKILFRIQKIENDEHFWDCKPVGDGIREMQINFAKDYRIYFKEKMEKYSFYSLAATSRLNKKTYRKWGYVQYGG